MFLPFPFWSAYNRIVILSTYEILGGNFRICQRAQLRCDSCERVFESTRGYQLKRDEHWCSVKCVNRAMRKDGSINQRIESLWSEKYGTTHPMLSKIVAEKHRTTTFERYGVNSPLQRIEARKELNTEATLRKKHETHKRNGTYRQSKPEIRFRQLLETRYGPHNVLAHIRPPNTTWPIDIRVLPIDTWIQIDGAFWHGLDRPIEQLRTSTKTVDSVILKKWNTDRAQEKWFQEHGLHLLRITDVAVHQLQQLPDDLASIAYFVC